ncbi:MAG: aminodeoxyfutalosine deaminase, partial [Verrucomicrobiota bacterium]
MIFRARAVVTMDGAPIENGAVATDGDRIVDVGAFDEVRARNSGEVVDLGERALLPGLINAHCHLDYTRLRGGIPRPRSFTDWIRAINAEKAKLSSDDYVASINEGFAEAKRFGTTTLLNLTAFPELIARIEPPIRTLWFPELIDVRGEVDVDLAAKFDGLAPHALFTASAKLFQLRVQLRTTHLAESAEEMEMFRDARGGLYEFLHSIGRDMSDCGRTTPLREFLGRVGDASLPQWIAAHLNELTADDFERLTRSTSKFHIVHCPRSHEYFGHSP